MSEAGFTPGPWHVTKFKDTKSWSIYAEGGRHSLASIRDGDNARLIAAAPELYEVLAGLVALLDANPTAEPAELMLVWRVGLDGEKAARAALAKASGEPRT